MVQKIETQQDVAFVSRVWCFDCRDDFRGRTSVFAVDLLLFLVPKFSCFCVELKLLTEPVCFVPYVVAVVTAKYLASPGDPFQVFSVAS